MTSRATLLLLLATTPALAQDPPRVAPTRDVVVTYRVEGEATTLVPGGLPGPVRLSWDAAGQRLRAEAEGRSQVALVDLHAHTGQVIDTALRVILPLPIRPADLRPLTLDGARLTSRGHDTVAGLPCTTYTVEAGRETGTVCLTPDGVMLRGEGLVDHKPGRFVATAVIYAPLPPALFVPPPGYMALTVGGKNGLNDLRALGQALGLGAPR